MKVYAQTICLKDDPKLIEEYKEYHRHCWPEVIIMIEETELFVFMCVDDPILFFCVSVMFSFPHQ